MQATWNLLEPLRRARRWPAPTTPGSASSSRRPSPTAGSTERGARLAPLLDAARARAAAPDALALAAVLAQPWADVVLSGAADVAALHSNLGALDAVWDPTIAAALTAVLEPPAAYWETRAGLAWD